MRTGPGVDFRNNLIALNVDLGETRVSAHNSVLQELGQSDDENLSREKKLLDFEKNKLVQKCYKQNPDLWLPQD